MADGSFSAGPSLPIIVAFDILPVFLYPFLAWFTRSWNSLWCFLPKFKRTVNGWTIYTWHTENQAQSCSVTSLAESPALNAEATMKKTTEGLGAADKSLCLSLPQSRQGYMIQFATLGFFLFLPKPLVCRGFPQSTKYRLITVSSLPPTYPPYFLILFQWERDSIDRLDRPQIILLPQFPKC